MEKNMGLAKEEFISSEQITEPVYIWNVIALIIVSIFSLFLLQSSFSGI